VLDDLDTLLAAVSGYVEFKENKIVLSETDRIINYFTNPTKITSPSKAIISPSKTIISSSKQHLESPLKSSYEINSSKIVYDRPSAMPYDPSQSRAAPVEYRSPRTDITATAGYKDVNRASYRSAYEQYVPISEKYTSPSSGLTKETVTVTKTEPFPRYESKYKYESYQGFKKTEPSVMKKTEETVTQKEQSIKDFVSSKPYEKTYETRYLYTQSPSQQQPSKHYY